MDLTPEEIDTLLTDYMYGDDRALGGLLAAGPASLRRLLAIRVGRVNPGWDMAEIMARDRDEYRRPGEAQLHLARAFPDIFFSEAAADPALESVVLGTLEHIEDPRALPFLERQLRSSSPESRRRALRGLAVHGTASHTNAVVACLADPEVRSEAVDTLARLGDARAAGPLLREHLAGDSHFARHAGEALDQVEQRIGGPLVPPVWRELGPVEFSAQAVMGLPWCVAEVLVEPGQDVRSGQLMAVLENDIVCQDLCADGPGTVTEVRIAAGGQVPEDAVVLVVQSRRRIG
ncbi:HEAT repeat domain-containing protein [Longispora albida]|uniref:HEAT repeat domain-containing protein n=1 Tax=Longispora albida TaxID=203523 RepID=UPI0003804DEA|nr:HEAT repeat domain-containing protein [Longispora albida]